MSACPNSACGFINEPAAARCVICGTPLEEEYGIPAAFGGYAPLDPDYEGAEAELAALAD